MLCQAELASSGIFRKDLRSPVNTWEYPREIFLPWHCSVCTSFKLHPGCRSKLTTPVLQLLREGLTLSMTRLRSLQACLEGLEDGKSTPSGADLGNGLVTPNILGWLTQKQQTERAQVIIAVHSGDLGCVPCWWPRRL